MKPTVFGQTVHSFVTRIHHNHDASPRGAPYVPQQRAKRKLRASCFSVLGVICFGWRKEDKKQGSDGFFLFKYDQRTKTTTNKITQQQQNQTHECRTRTMEPEQPEPTKTQPTTTPFFCFLCVSFLVQARTGRTTNQHQQTTRQHSNATTRSSEWN